MARVRASGKVLGKVYGANKETNRDQIALKFSDMADIVEKVVTEATKEVQIEKGLEEVEVNWKREISLFTNTSEPAMILPSVIFLSL